jgi:hypothetical protein
VAAEGGGAALEELAVIDSEERLIFTPDEE